MLDFNRLFIRQFLHLKGRVVPGIQHGLKNRFLGPLDRLVPGASLKTRVINLSNYRPCGTDFFRGFFTPKPEGMITS